MKHPQLTVLILLFFASIGKTQTQKQIDWSKDIDFLGKKLPALHYNFFTLKSKETFLSGLNEIKTQSPQLSDFQVALKLQQLIAAFGDAHTKINFEKFIAKDRILPLFTYWFCDGLFILQTNQENSELIGKQLLGINGTPIKTIIDSISTIITKENQAIIKNSIPSFLSYIQVLEAFGFVKNGEIELETKDDDGQTKKYAIKPFEMNKSNFKTFITSSIPVYRKNEKQYFTEDFFETDSLYYLQYNKCWSKELEIEYGNAQKAEQLPSFKQFEDKVFETLNSKPINKLVFDMRLNGGGNSKQGTDFIEKLSKFLVKHPHLKLYVVIGRKTFSSAILNILDFNRLTKAIFVGEDTSGKPNHFGETKSFQLPSSEMRVTYSTKFFKRTDENFNTIRPERILETCFFDYAKGIDPVLDWIKKQ